MYEDFRKIIEEYYSQHDQVSYRTSWHEQFLIERILDLQGFIHSISNYLEPERLEYSEHTYPLGFYEVEQPSRIRYVKIIFIFTLIERRLRALCGLIKDVKNVELDLDNYKGSILIKAKQFLKESLNVEFNHFADWDEVLSFQKVRDCIIHCGGFVNESRDNDFLISMSQQSKKLIEISPDGYLYISKAYSRQIESIAISFISTLIDKLFYELKGYHRYPEELP
jgi:hypothetical protein